MVQLLTVLKEEKEDDTLLSFRFKVCKVINDMLILDLGQFAEQVQSLISSQGYQGLEDQLILHYHLNPVQPPPAQGVHDR